MTTRLYRNAQLLTMDPTIGDLPRGDLLVEGRRIAAVAEHLGAPAGAEVIDADGCIIVPGFIDTHRHMWQGLLRGIGPEHTLSDYFDIVLHRYGPSLTPAQLYTGESLSAHAALASGITTVQDISNIQDSPGHTEALVAALRDSGLRAVLAYGNSLPTMARAGTALPEDARRTRTTLLPDDTALVTMSLITEPGGSDDAERANADMARDLDLRTARHFSDAYSLAHLDRLDCLLPGTTFIHGNGLAPDDLRMIADHGGHLSVSAPIEMSMGHGYPMAAAAATVDGLLTTISADVETTVSGDMFGQLRSVHQTARHARLRAGGDAPTVRDVLRMATADGARALGLADRTGSLTPGKDADLVVLRADRLDVLPTHDPYSAVVLQMDRSHIDQVLVAGHRHVMDGRLTADTTELRALTEQYTPPRTG